MVLGILGFFFPILWIFGAFTEGPSDIDRVDITLFIASGAVTFAPVIGDEFAVGGPPSSARPARHPTASRASARI